MPIASPAIHWSPQPLRAALLCASLALAAGPAGADLFDELAVHGYQTWTWRNNSVSGGGGGNQAFSLDNFGYDNSFDNNTSLTVDGEIIDSLRIHANLNKSRYMPTDRRYYLKWEGNDTDVILGDLNASLSGNEFATLSRTMRGLQIDSTLGDKYGLSMLASKTEAATNQDVIPGNNTVGPYYLTRSPIVDGSEEVRVDEQVMQRGQDYIIDYSFGVLTFQGVNVIPNTSTIAVSYEYDAPGQTAGTLVGIRGTIPITQSFTLGTTVLMQQGSGRGGGAQTGQVSHREEFFGSNSVGPYSLVFRPIIDGTEIITVAAVPQVRNVDYEINYLSGLITFARAVSLASLIVVDYQYETTVNPASQDHNILGFDGAWKFTETAGVNFEFAFSDGGRERGDTNPESGMALNLRGAGKFGKLDAAVGFRKVNDGFRRLANTGFQRNESGFDVTLNYQAGQYVNVQSRLNNYDSDSSLNFGVTGAFNQGLGGVTTQGNKSKTSQMFTTLSLAYPKLPELRLNFQRMSNDTTTSTNTSTMSSVDALYKLGKLTTQGQLSLSKQDFSSAGAALSGATNILGANANETRSGRLSLAYQASEKLRGGIDFSANAVIAGQQTTSTSDTLNLGVSWTPNAKLMVSANHYLSNSEGGFSGGFGSYGGGFYSGYGGGYSSYGGGYGSSYGGGYSSLGSFGSGVGTLSSSSYGSYGSSAFGGGSYYGGASSYGGYSSGYGSGYGGGGYSGGYGSGYNSGYSSGYGSGYGTGGGYNSGYYSSGGWGTGLSGSNNSYYPGFTDSTGVNYGGVGVDSSFGAGSTRLYDNMGMSSSRGGLFDSVRRSPMDQRGQRTVDRAQPAVDGGAADAPPEKRPDAPITVTVRGTVEIGGGDPIPLAGARVVLGGKVATTDEHGKYEFLEQTVAPLPTAKTPMTVSKDQFETFLDDNVELKPGEETTVGTVRLTPRPETGSVTGKVVRFTDGTAVVNAKITLGTGDDARSVRTDDGGAFLLTGIAPGKHTYTVSQGGFEVVTGTIEDLTAGKTLSLPEELKLVPTTGEGTTGEAEASAEGPTARAVTESLHPATHSRLRRVPPQLVAMRHRQLAGTGTEPNQSRSVYTTLTAQYAFNDRLSVNSNFSHQVSDGTGFVSNSTSDDLSLGFSYRATDSLFFLGQWTGQTLTFLDVGGDTTSDIIWLGAQWGQSNGLNVNLDYQRMSTSSPSTFAGTGVAAAVPGANSAAAATTAALMTNTSTITLGVRYPIHSRLYALGQYQTVTSSGNDIFANDRNSLRFGLEYEINRVMSLRAEMEKIDSSNDNDPSSNYSATVMSTQLSLRF